MGRASNTHRAVAAPSRASARSATAAIDLSDSERAQLGTVRLRADGAPSAHPYPSLGQWREIRKHLLARSLKSNPSLDTALTAYTPGETLALLNAPAVAAWHEDMRTLVLPESYDTVVFVPCAKTKPWEGPGVKRSKLYSAYNELRPELPSACFVTISEPLGIVPMQHWSGSFPQYDNPGLFRDDAQRSGMTTKQWEDSPFRHHYGLPFDEAAWEESISRLGSVIGAFLGNHAERRMIAVVDNGAGPKATHSSMLDVALRESGATVARHAKRVQAHVSPLSYLRGVLQSSG